MELFLWGSWPSGFEDLKELEEQGCGKDLPAQGLLPSTTSSIQSKGLQKSPETGDCSWLHTIIHPRFHMTTTRQSMDHQNFILTEPISWPRAALTTPLRIYSWKNTIIINQLCGFSCWPPAPALLHMLNAAFLLYPWLMGVESG